MRKHILWIICLSGLLGPAAMGSLSLPGTPTLDPFKDVRARLKATAPSPLWEKPFPFCFAWKFNQTPRSLRMDLMGRLLGSQVQLVEDKSNCPAQLKYLTFSTVVDLEQASENFLVFGAKTACSNGRCQVMALGLFIKKFTPADKKTLHVVYDYLVDSGLLGIVLQNDPDKSAPDGLGGF